MMADHNSSQVQANSAAKPAWPAQRTAWTLVLVLMITNVFSFADRLLVTLFAEPIKEQFLLSDTQIGLLQGAAFGIFYGLLGLPLAWLADRYSRLRIVVAGAALWSLMTFLAGLAKSFPFFFATRTGVAVGEATLSPSAFSMISDSFPPHKLSLPIGVFAAGVPLGTAAAFIGGGALYQYFLAGGGDILSGIGVESAWQKVFVTMGLLGLLFLPLYIFISEPVRREHSSFASQGRLADLGPLFRRERATLVPVIVGYAFATFSASGISSWMPALLMRSYDMSVGDVGAALGAIFLFAGLFGSLFGGALADWVEARGLVSGKVAVAALAVGIQIIPNILGPLSSSLATVFVCYGLTIVLGQMAAAPCAAVIQTLTPNRLRAKVSAGFFLLFNVFGVGFGPVAVALFSDHVFPQADGLRYAIAAIAAIGGPVALFCMVMAYLGMMRKNSRDRGY